MPTDESNLKPSYKFESRRYLSQVLEVVNDNASSQEARSIQNEKEKDINTTFQLECDKMLLDDDLESP